MRSFIATAFLASTALAYDSLFAFNQAPVVENRTLDEISTAALAEGGVVTLWAGGDEVNQQNGLKAAFEARFPGMTLNVTVDVSKYHDGKIDRQLSEGNLYVDVAVLQTLHDFPRWAKEDALINYKPVHFDKINPAYRDAFGAWYALYMFNWSGLTNTAKLPAGTVPPVEWDDYLRPEFKDKLVITYPNDDDAVLYAFDLIMQQYGLGWFEDLLKQNPYWVRGSETPYTVVNSANFTQAVTFTTTGNTPPAPINVTHPTQGQFVSWPQTGAIFKDAPHPESAKLLFNFFLSTDYQESLTAAGAFSVRDDITPPSIGPISNFPGTNPTEFYRFMTDRVRVERLKLYFESVIGSAQGVSPLIDAL